MNNFNNYEDFKESLATSKELFDDLVEQYLKLRKEHWELLDKYDNLKSKYDEIINQNC